MRTTKSAAPWVSVVLPVRDGARTLGAALASLGRQTLRDWELVVVDDGSEDATPDLLREAAREEARVRPIFQGRLGIVAALQRGCSAAAAPLIARMDADDVMSPDRLERQLEYLDADPGTGLVSCRVRYGGDPGSQAGYGAHVAWLNSLRTPEEMSLRRFVEAPVAHPSVMFRRELLDRHGGYASGEFPEDYELWLRWLEAGVRFGKVDAELLTWNDSPGRLSRTDPRYAPEAFYRLKCGYLARWLRTHVPGGRHVWLWGAGRVTRQRFRGLENEGTPIAGFIDVDRNKIGRGRDGRRVVSPEELPGRGEAFIVAGVGKRGAREYIHGCLVKLGWREGRDFLLAA